MLTLELRGIDICTYVANQFSSRPLPSFCSDYSSLIHYIRVSKVKIDFQESTSKHPPSVRLSAM